MDRHLVIGTAGHIDHGKTALVLALTGVDTDRWQEEKRRGITIDIGFARLELGDGVDASVVDVPGHEAFVKNMLAGATGIDLAMLVVAADEGVMPQTVEHLAILDLLGVTRGVPVLTKTDLVDADWLGLVREELREQLRASRVAWSEAIGVSAKEGTGLDALRATLLATASEVERHSAKDLFRLPIDRVFSLPGAGTVVTGTTWTGSVGRGDAVRILPAGATARIRSIQVHGEPAERATPGRRTALALLDVSRDDIARGETVVTDRAWRPTSRLACQLEILPGAPRPLRRRERVRVHLGTAAIMGRMLGGRDLRPGERSEAAVLELEHPVVARAGDRFVLRAASPVTTIGGGVIRDPYPGDGPPARDLETLVRQGGTAGLSVDDLPLRLPMTAAIVQTTLDALPGGLRRLGGRLVADDVITALQQTLRASVVAHHDAAPWEAGISLQALRAGAGAPDEVVDVALQAAVAAGELVVDASIVRAPSWDVTAQPENAALIAQIQKVIEEPGIALTAVQDLEATFGARKTRALLAVMTRAGQVAVVGRDHYISPAALDRFGTMLTEVVGRLGRAKPSELREALGLTRKHLIPLLEWADRSGLTRREGDARVLAS